MRIVHAYYPLVHGQLDEKVVGEDIQCMFQLYTWLYSIHRILSERSPSTLSMDLLMMNLEHMLERVATCCGYLYLLFR
jgi:hypothetical protein